MNDQSDSQLLRAYAEQQAEPAFRELVRRHLDFVHSAALRMVCDSHLAQDVSQAVFIALAKNAAQLAARPVLAGWLHRTTQNIAAQIVRTDVRRRRREQEAVAMTELLSTAPDASWHEVAPHLDAALGELSEPDRDAVLLRYFQKKSAAEMAHVLGVSDDAAQKRVNRAVERLRELFAKRGIAVGASGLVLAITANAVPTAPVGLSVTISAATALAGTTLAATAIKIIAMTTLQKTLITAVIAAAVGAAIYEARQVSTLRTQVQTLGQKQAGQLEQLQRERDDATAKFASLRDEHERLKNNAADLPKLRSEVSRLRAGEQELARLRAENQIPANPSAPATNRTDLPKDSWADVGFATPQVALQTRGWAVLNGNRERFKESVFITDGARKTLEDMLVQMAAASNHPDKDKTLKEILNNKYGVEEALLMPLMGKNQAKSFTGYHILSQKSSSADEMFVEVETRMASAPAERETLKFQRFGADWKVVIDEDFIKAAR